MSDSLPFAGTVRIRFQGFTLRPGQSASATPSEREMSLGLAGSLSKRERGVSELRFG